MNIVANILPLTLPKEGALLIAGKVKDARLAKNYSRKTLAERAGIGAGSLKRFEETGEVSFVSLMKIASVLGCMDDFNGLFEPPETMSMKDVLLSQKTRKRGMR